ncbi:PXA domain-containing protein [Ampelomyces quisqualis]|uniref:PXA domain-containing protein n=1 Tax=Ampelomyces quisqualis TaxID=50730 RepID=A0A6A5QMI6_AMPQU|nr:PXA domain-containing protein [Ampelomyces quisqualis]
MTDAVPAAPRARDRGQHRTEAPAAPQEAQPAPAYDASALADGALQFLATASNETLGACLVGLGAGTYLVLGRVGLVLMGVVGGVVLHATWGGEGAQKSSGDAARRRELGVDVAHRLLGWRDSRTAATAHGEDDRHDPPPLSLDYSAFEPETAAALTELTDAVVRDYVKWWYAPVLPADETFPSACRQTFTALILSVSAHLSRKRPADTFVDFATRSSSFFIILLQELSAAVTASPGDAPAEAVDIYLKMKRDSTLASILDSDYQARQFSTAAHDILHNYLEHTTYSCVPARTFLHQVLAKLVLEMIVTTCAKPEWINGWIVYLLEDGEPELLNAIDAGVEGANGKLQGVKARTEKTAATSGQGSSSERREHKRVVSRAQDAMDEAMQEAQRLSQMIAEEDAKRLKEQQRQSASTSTLNDDQSESTTQGIVTPTSSQSETPAESDFNELGISGLSARSFSQATPASPPEAPEEPPHEVKRAFTSFDQLLPNNPPTALLSNAPAVEAPPPLTLHNATMSIFDDSLPGEKATIKNRPNTEYLIQIEPKSNHHSGWMTARKYAEFETLHEVIRRIAAITGTTAFTEAHSILPPWKGHTKASLRGELERYLNDAVNHKPLAESEGMKRFLEKELGSGKSPAAGFPGIGWAGQTFDTMGKGMIDVLSKAPKEVAGGGKALFGGVTGVLGSVTTPLGGSKKYRDTTASSSNTPASDNSPTLSRSTSATGTIQTRHNRAESTVSELPTHIRTESSLSLATKRTSIESARSPIIDQQPQREAPMERRPSYNPDGDGKRSGVSSRLGSRSNSRAPSVRDSVDLSSVMGGDQLINLPPMPSEIPDDYGAGAPRAPMSNDPLHACDPSRASTTTASSSQPTEAILPLPRRLSNASLSTNPTTTKPAPSKLSTTTHAALTESETTVLIELFFATINELYTLSSAWTLRRTLLNAAKTFLLRPGNPQLSSITSLLQTTVLDANLSDTGLAYHIRKMRENGLPTPDELAGWPKEMSAEEKETLRMKARRLAVERGMPAALTSVMGQAASGEAVGRVFDCLQEPRVARGVMFGLVLQGLRGVTQ